MRSRGLSTAGRLGRWLALGLALGVGQAPPAAAQQPPGTVPDSVVDRALIHAGPFFLHPTLALRDVGTDSNVFNDSENPQEDFTLTLVPALSGGFRVGPVRLMVVDTVEYVWYKEVSSQRSVNGGLTGQFEIRWNRLRPFVDAQAVRTRARAGDEIDVRARRSASTYGGGADLGIASRTWLTLEYQYRKTTYDAGASYGGVPLDQALNERTRAASVGMRFELSPLTRLDITGRLEQVRFATSTFRDNDSYLVSGAFTFDPDALLAGSASVGYRNLRARTEGTPDFRGPTARVSLIYTGLPSTRFGVGVNRDIAYSYENQYAYYVSTEVSASVTQNVVGPLELVARGRRAWLDYTGAVGAAPGRRDRVDTYGGGIGFRLGDVSRLGFEAAWIQRRSEVLERNYKGLRLFGSINYGF